MVIVDYSFFYSNIYYASWATDTAFYLDTRNNPYGIYSRAAVLKLEHALESPGEIELGGPAVGLRICFSVRLVDGANAGDRRPSLETPWSRAAVPKLGCPFTSTRGLFKTLILSLHPRLHGSNYLKWDLGTPLSMLYQLVSSWKRHTNQETK